MLFSQRYFRAIENNMLVVDIAYAARRKLWAWLSANNASLHIQRDPNDSWTSNSSILEETERKLLVERGWDRLPMSPDRFDAKYTQLCAFLFSMVQAHSFSTPSRLP